MFGGLPVQQEQQELRCGLAVVDLSNGAVVGLLWFKTGLEEIFSVTIFLGWHNPAVIGPDNRTDATQTVWLVPPTAN